MTGITLDVDVSGCAEILADLSTLQERLSDLSGPMAAIGETLVSIAKESFENESSPAGERWKPSIRALAEGGQTLALKGILKNSLSYQPGQHQVSAGSAVIYAAIHQFGGEAGRNHSVILPARPYMPDKESLPVSEIEGILRDHLFTGLV